MATEQKRRADGRNLRQRAKVNARQATALRQETIFFVFRFGDRRS